MDDKDAQLSDHRAILSLVTDPDKIMVKAKMYVLPKSNVIISCLHKCL